VILIVYRHKVAPGTEAAFVDAWERCKTRTLAKPNGLLDASIFRNEGDATEFVCLSRWESIEAWKKYWGDGVPDPEGELPKNEILVELKTLARNAS
jgi:heme-degrading monooxygenase HmoA